MTKVEFEIAKVYEEELLQILRNAERIRLKLAKLCDEESGTLLGVYYKQDEDCLEYSFKDADDDYSNRLFYVNSVEEMKENALIDVEDEEKKKNEILRESD